MSIIDLFESSEHRNNMAHFAAIYNLAISDGEVNESEKRIILKFKDKLDITDDEYYQIAEEPNKYPIIPQSNLDNRLERILDFFKIIFSDHQLDSPERNLVLRYAIQLGYSETVAKDLISKSERIFNYDFDIEEFRGILKAIE
ncbi:tellurite resistance TerB family protein [Pseudofulvibacter geojedonensis]|uniref:TerB family tellurite resistance protein n=1 Tax=Pseudofulvibacter geojedonensis TaxID=1123758 RepID=A0ABW3I1R3_9FLAO